MFTPAQLGITAKRYGVDHFFSDVKSHTRFSISYIPLSRLMDPDCAISPIARIGKFLDKANLSSDIDENRILYELRTLANLFSAEMKATHRLLSGIAKEGTNPTIITKIELFLKETETFLHVFRALHARFMEPSITERLRTALRWTDESISLSAEKMLFTFTVCSGRKHWWKRLRYLWSTSSIIAKKWVIRRLSRTERK